ncbi:MAG: primase C-terminal domain-containing protein [Truepera sp.]|nr:primase C-terminal domain-containing protein [Truepera sp.]
MPPLETVEVGHRNIALFDEVRFWAYGQPRGRDLEEWLYSVETYALLQNERFPQPLPEAEVLSTAYSVSTWCEVGGE